MKRIATMAAACALLTTAGGAALADDFDNMAMAAQQVDSPTAFAALFWSHKVNCKAADNDLDRRQCQVLRDARAAQTTENVYLVTGDSTAVSLGEYDERKKSVAVEVHACVGCATGIELGDGPRYVVGRGAVEVAGGAVQGPVLHKTARSFPSADKASAWLSGPGARLRTEFLVKLLPDTWSKSGVEGFRVDVVGFRVYDACTGDVVATKPASARTTAEASACPEGAGAPVVKKPVESNKPTPEPAAPAKPALPERLSPYQINRAMAPVNVEARKCYVTYGVQGDAKFQITINSGGAVTKIDQTGDFVGTPTGDCLEKAIKRQSFPKISKPSMFFDYPIMLR